MERVGALISKLQEQLQQHANAEQLKITTQMLLAELQQAEVIDENNARKISVVMPLKSAIVSEIIAPNIMIEKPESVKQQIKLPKENEEPALPAMNEPATTDYKYKNSQWGLNPLVDVPTLAHQNKENIEVNERLNGNTQSFNERLRVEKIELGTSLKNSPVRDLKKAIGVNDRFLFIKELFRGDETMYERSIKTINAFHIYPEAQYWIQRELKLKIGWSDDNPSVAHFEELVKRRFS